MIGSGKANPNNDWTLTIQPQEALWGVIQRGNDSNLPVDTRFSNQGGSMMSVVSHALMLPYIIVARLLDLAPFSTYAYVQLVAAPIGSAVVILRERTR